MMQSTHAELREAAAKGAMPSRWASAGGSARPPPCTADKYHHWSEERADDALTALYGIEYVEACGACKMRRIELPPDGGGGAGKKAYAPGIEYAIWAVAYRARGYARAAWPARAAGGIAAPRAGGGSGRGGAWQS